MFSFQFIHLTCFLFHLFILHVFKRAKSTDSKVKKKEAGVIQLQPQNNLFHNKAFYTKLQATIKNLNVVKSSLCVTIVELDLQRLG